MVKVIINFFFGFFMPLFMFGQITKAKCDKIKCGTFFFYPANKQSAFVVIRKNGIQKEINLGTRDTSFWRINWRNNCSFDLKFIRKSRPISDEEKDFYKSHVPIINIINIGDNYYVFKAGLDSINHITSASDTIWFKARNF